MENKQSMTSSEKKQHISLAALLGVDTLYIGTDRCFGVKAAEDVKDGETGECLVKKGDTVSLAQAEKLHALEETGRLVREKKGYIKAVLEDSGCSCCQDG